MKISFDGSKQLVVYAVDKHHPHGRENMLFDRSVVGEHAEISPFLYEECLRREIQLVTPDIYFSLPQKPAKTIFIMDGATSGSTRDLARAGLRPVLLMVIESPIYPCRFFYNLERETKPFDYAMLPRGAAPRVAKTTKFLPFIPTQLFTGTERVQANFLKRKYLTIITTNKRVHHLRRLYVHVMQFLKPFPSFVDRELYRDRLEAIRYFSHDPEFDLYGRGWNDPVRYEDMRYREAITKSYRGAADRKLPVLMGYKFSICFENSIFDGYVTEKIIDSLFAGCVPVYWGAPDIADYVPKECFIDFRNFKSYEALEKYLKNMDEKTFNGYIENMNKFISSDQYHNYFSKEKFAEDIIKILKSYF